MSRLRRPKTSTVPKPLAMKRIRISSGMALVRAARAAGVAPVSRFGQKPGLTRIPTGKDPSRGS